MSDRNAAVDAATVAQRLERVRNRIADAGGDPARVQVLAVTKGFGWWAPAVAAEAGAGMVGESYAQEMAAKFDELDANGGPAQPLEVHFIGRMQTNKVRKVASRVDVWQSVDRIQLAAEIAKRSPGARILLQLDVAGVEAQGGCRVADAAELLSRCRDLGLSVQGCMAIGAQAGPAEIRAGFREVVGFCDRFDLEERSLGMSADLEHAVAEGSTMIRVGTALFGERPAR